MNRTVAVSVDAIESNIKDLGRMVKTARAEYDATPGKYNEHDLFKEKLEVCAAHCLPTLILLL